MATEGNIKDGCEILISWVNQMRNADFQRRMLTQSYQKIRADVLGNRLGDEHQVFLAEPLFSMIVSNQFAEGGGMGRLRGLRFASFLVIRVATKTIPQTTEIPPAVFVEPTFGKPIAPEMVSPRNPRLSR